MLERMDIHKSSGTILEHFPFFPFSVLVKFYFSFVSCDLAKFSGCAARASDRSPEPQGSDSILNASLQRRLDARLLLELACVEDDDVDTDSVARKRFGSHGRRLCVYVCILLLHA